MCVRFAFGQTETFPHVSMSVSVCHLVCLSVSGCLSVSVCLSVYLCLSVLPHLCWLLVISSTHVGPLTRPLMILARIKLSQNNYESCAKKKKQNEPSQLVNTPRQWLRCFFNIFIYVQYIYFYRCLCVRV